MYLYKLPEIKIIIFALILLRMIGFIISSAIFGSTNINASIKVLLSLVLSMVVFSTLNIHEVEKTIDTDYLIMMSLREIVLGLLLGFLTRFFFFTLSMAGDFISVSIGLGSAQLFNPAMGNTGNVIEQFYALIATLVFFAIEGHSMLLTAICRSFQIAPIAQNHFNYVVFGDIPSLLQTILIMVIKICSPVLVSILVTNISMGVLGRVIPQINVQVTTMPITLLLGFGVMFISLPLLVLEMNGVLDISVKNLFMFLKSI